MRLDSVQPTGVERDVNQFDVVSGGVVTDPPIRLGGQVRAEVVHDDRQPPVLGVQRAHIAQEGEELAASLARLDVPVEPVDFEVLAQARAAARSAHRVLRLRVAGD